MYIAWISIDAVFDGAVEYNETSSRDGIASRPKIQNKQMKDWNRPCPASIN